MSKTPLHLPYSFQEKIVNCFGDEGRKWLASLANRMEQVTHEWGLTIVAPVPNLSYNYVLFVLDSDRQACALKMSLPGHEFENEVKALQTYGSDGSVKLLQVDVFNGAMLLERLQPGTMLSEEHDENKAIQLFCEVWKKSRRPLPERHVFPMMTDWATAFTNYCASNSIERPIPVEIVQKANNYMQELSMNGYDIQLLHGDLHHDNILFSEHRGWIAIDPKGVGGNPVFDIVPFLVNHLFKNEDPQSILSKRIDSICEQLVLDRSRLLKAAYAMSILKACWSIESKDWYWKEMYQCARWFEELLMEEQEEC